MENGEKAKVGKRGECEDIEDDERGKGQENGAD